MRTWARSLKTFLQSVMRMEVARRTTASYRRIYCCIRRPSWPKLLTSVTRSFVRTIAKCQGHGPQWTFESEHADAPLNDSKGIKISLEGTNNESVVRSHNCSNPQRTLNNYSNCKHEDVDNFNKNRLNSLSIHQRLIAKSSCPFIDPIQVMKIITFKFNWCMSLIQSNWLRSWLVK